MFQSPIDEIKNRLDIVGVISSYIQLKKAGANYRAICPFHSEKTPSFFVSPARQIWHCFGGCSTGGDIFKFVMKIEGVEFGDALKTLAQKAGVELLPQTREFAAWRTERQRLQEICELAAKFFEKQLESKTGQDAKKYLISRGITEDSIRKWRLGYAPDVWQGLADFLFSKRYKKEEIEKAGLGLTSEQGSFYDRFRGRIIFPIFDLNSQIIGFGGRVFRVNPRSYPRESASTEAKYVNTPNTALYDKSKVLYGLDRAKIEIRRKGFCVLVEGYTDAILAHQAGFENVAAVSGTALTPFQLKILKRYSENILTAFDMDKAGDSATKRGIDLAQILGFNIKVILMPEDKDPADVISQNPKDWEGLVQGAKSILDFYFETTFSKLNGKTGEGKKEISKILLPLIKRIPNKIERAHWLAQLAKKLEVKEEDVIEELNKTKLEEDVFGLEPEEIITLPQKSRRELLEERFLMLLLKKPENLNLVEEAQMSYFSAKGKEILAGLKKNQKPEQDLSPEARDYFNCLALKSEVEEIEEREILDETKFCLKEIQSMEIHSQLNEISKEIKKAEDSKDSEKIKNLRQEVNRLSKEII